MNAPVNTPPPMNALPLEQSNNKVGEMPMPAPVEPAMNEPMKPVTMPAPVPPQPTMPVPAPTPPVMTGGNYYEDSIKENFQIGNARTNRNKSKKKKVRRGTSFSKKGRKGVKVL